jgi:hypothetical protein
VVAKASSIVIHSPDIRVDQDHRTVSPFDNPEIRRTVVADNDEHSFLQLMYVRFALSHEACPFF